jgi:hypothetical protein
MKYTKTSIGEIAFLETDANYKDSLKKIPKEARVMKPTELLTLWINERTKLKGFPTGEYTYIWTENYASFLDGFVDGSKFVTYDWIVYNPYRLLRGVCIVKKV